MLLVSGYGALASAVGKDMLWHLSMDLLQQIKPAALEPNAVLLSSAAASLQQGVPLGYQRPTHPLLHPPCI